MLHYTHPKPLITLVPLVEKIYLTAVLQGLQSRFWNRTRSTSNKKYWSYYHDEATITIV